MSFKNILNKYDLPILAGLILLPCVSLIALPVYIYYYGIVWQEPLFLVIGWFVAGMGITMGYHRLFSHRTFKTYPLIEWIFMLSGSMALQNTIINWCSDHRRHHKKLDTEDDPYSITKGFFHAHIGWVVKKNNSKCNGVSDLRKKSAVKFQTKYYWAIALFSLFILPVIIGSLYDRPFGGLLWGGILRVTLVHHCTFFINSLCHYLGKKQYDLDTTASDSWYMAFLTFGEGFHNYHHKFQWDYRNGIKWYNFDPGKWIIKFLSFFKLTYALKKAPEYSILEARLDTLKKKITASSQYFNMDKTYINKMKNISNYAFESLDLLKSLEKKYSTLKLSTLSKHEKYFYKQKKKLYKIQLNQAIQSMMLCLVSLKNIH